MGATLQGPWCDNYLIQKTRTNNYSNDKQCQQQLLQGETQVNWFGDDCKHWKPDVRIKLVCIALLKNFKGKNHWVGHGPPGPPC